MQCNQPFYGNGFTNGSFGSPFNTPLQSTQGMYPEIVGEGQVTSITLPDGSVQFFFMPTLKWWSPSATQCQPFQTIPNPMFANTNYSIPLPYNNTIGTWFIRSISNPFPQSAFNSPTQRNETPRLTINSNYNQNLNSHDLGYQVKFHNDGGTSTTDLVYFYPGLRQRDFVFMPPCKDKTVQIDTGPVTNNTVCHYQVVCSKPCNCSLGARPMSLETLVVPNLIPKSNQSCNCSAKPISFESPADPRLTPKSIKTCNCSICIKATSFKSPADPNLTSKSIKTCNCSVRTKPTSLEPPVDPNLTSKSIKTCNCSVSTKSVNLKSPADPNLTSKSIKTCNCSVRTKHMSLEPPVDPNLTSKSIKTCNCSVSTKPVSLKPPVDPNLTTKTDKPCNYSADVNKTMSLEAPVDQNLTLKSKQPCSSAAAKPMTVDSPADPNLTPKSKKSENYSGQPMSLECLMDPNPAHNISTDDSSYSKEQNKRGKYKKKSKIICGCHLEEKKKKRHKSNKIICECDPNIVTMDKSITTYADESVGSNPAEGRETQTNRTEDITSQCDVEAKPIQNKSPLKTKWFDKSCSSDCSTCDERSRDDTKDKKYIQRNRGGKYKRSKPNKCECGCCDCDSSVDCCTASEVETVASKDKGRETPLTCSTYSNTTVLEMKITRGSPIKIGKKASIGKENSSLQWLTSDNVSQKCELNEKEMSEPSVSPARVMDGKTPEEPDHTCTECDAAASTCGDGHV